MRTTPAAALAALSTAALATTLLSAPPASAARTTGNSTSAIGLTSDQRLIAFDVRHPERAKKIGAVTGLVGDTKLVGIDYRVQDNGLYGVGDQGGVYKIYASVAKAAKVSQLTVPLVGTAFGVDFNPAADRLRIISDTGQNLRHDVLGGTTINDGFLTYPAPPAPNTPAAGVSAAAYTNNDLSPNTATTLFDIDTKLDQVAVQSPANGGTLAATGKLYRNATSVGFDIKTQRAGGVAVQNTGYAAMTVNGTARFYRIDLTSGRAAPIGAFPTYRQVVDIALPTRR